MPEVKKKTITIILNEEKTGILTHWWGIVTTFLNANWALKVLKFANVIFFM